MTQEKKSLLLKDLCARVPYHPKGHVVNACNGAECDEWLTCATFTMFTNITNNCRLYLRPMSSMTYEEKKEFIHCAEYEVEESVNGNHYEYYLKDYTGTTEKPICNCNAIDWLNANHFDYRGLIPMDLAIEVTKENNPYKE